MRIIRLMDLSYSSSMFFTASLGLMMIYKFYMVTSFMSAYSWG